ncbi:TIR domain-containing protein, partial [Nonomuraea sp. RK-328]|nr:TIR domain-containing protein [Nonomuraea sp. RK-328]
VAETAVYDAFISYSHTADTRLAPVLETGLRAMGKPWYRRRALRVFRDQASLPAAPELWPSIERALAASRHLVLLASPEAAASRWVGRELQWWRDHRSPSTVLIVLTGGELAWDDDLGGFDPSRTTALPAASLDWFRGEPLWVDLRWARGRSDLSPREPRLHGCVADVAAPLHGIAKDELIGEDLRQHRRTLRLTRTAAALLTMLAVLAGTMAVVAARNREEAAGQRDLAERRALLAAARRLSAEAIPLLDDDPALSTRLSLAAFRLADTAETRSGLLAQVQRRSRVAAFLPVLSGPVSALAFSPDGRTLATGTYYGRLDLWDVRGRAHLASIPAHTDTVKSLAFAPGGRLLASGGYDGRLYLWDVARRARTGPALPAPARAVSGVTFSPDGRLLASATDRAVLLWDVARRTRHGRPLTGHTAEVTSVAFSSNGRLLVSGGDDGKVIVWDAARGTRHGPPLAGHGDPVFGVAFAPGGPGAAAGTVASGTARVGTARVGTARVGTARGGTAKVGAARGETVGGAVAPVAEGDTVASGSMDGSVALWDLRTGRARLLRRPTGVGDAVHGVAFGPDGRTLVTVSENGSADL